VARGTASQDPRRVAHGGARSVELACAAPATRRRSPAVAPARPRSARNEAGREEEDDDDKWALRVSDRE
jgi:hypothetical protein